MKGSNTHPNLLRLRASQLPHATQHVRRHSRAQSSGAIARAHFCTTTQQLARCTHTMLCVGPGPGQLWIRITCQLSSDIIGVNRRVLASFGQLLVETTHKLSYTVVWIDTSAPGPGAHLRQRAAFRESDHPPQTLRVSCLFGMDSGALNECGSKQGYSPHDPPNSQHARAPSDDGSPYGTHGRRSHERKCRT